MALQNGKKIEIELRRHKVIEMKMAGASERSIAEKLGLHHTTVYNDVKKGLSAEAERHNEAYGMVRTLMNLRYNRLLLSWWQQALNGDSKAANIVLGILKDIREVNGLDPKEPIQIDNRTQILMSGEYDDPIGALESRIAVIASRGRVEGSGEGAGRGDGRQASPYMEILGETEPTTT